MTRRTRPFVVSLALLAPLALAAPTAVVPSSAEAAEAEQARAPTAYSLYCRGGGNQIVKVDSTTTKDRYLDYDITVQIKHGAEKYDPSSLKPGHCTWVDRKMKGGEPYEVMLSGSRKLHTFRTTYFGKRLKLALRDPWGRPEIPKPLEAVNKLQYDGNVVELRVYAKTIETRSLKGKKIKQNVLYVDSVGVIHNIAPPSNKG